MLNLGAAISEYEDKEMIPFLWEEPDKYNSIFENDVFIISGRKGSGKSTITDFREYFASADEHVLIIRPDEQDDLYDRLREIAEDLPYDQFDLRQSLAKVFEFVAYLKSMKYIINGEKNRLLTGNLMIVYDYLEKNSLIDGSIVKRGLDVAAKVTKDFKYANRLFTLLENIPGPTFRKARQAFHDHIVNNKIFIRVFIDDIDGYGFEYNSRTKALAEGMIVAAMKTSTFCKKNGIGFRIIAAPPTELFDNSTFWNRDKITAKCVFIRWHNIQKLHDLVNKRISAELGFRKRKKKTIHDIFSTDLKYSWERVFKNYVQNRIGSSENTFEYVARHTFYTPRNILSTCQRILEYLEDMNYNLDTVQSVSDADWNEAVQESCEEKSNSMSDHIIKIFSNLVDGISDLLSKFEGRPNIWTKGALKGFLYEEGRDLLADRQTGKKLSSDESLMVLYQMGFIGYAFRCQTAPTGCRYYDLFFSYLRWTLRKRWEIAVISPVFYDNLRIHPLEKIVVKPHNQLRLNWNQHDRILSYSHATNAFGH